MQWLINIIERIRRIFKKPVIQTVKKSVKSAIEKGIKKFPNHEQFRYSKHGKVYWDSKTDTYRRRGPKIGRNDNCPCGAMRTSPRNESLPAKFKHCCGKKG